MSEAMNPSNPVEPVSPIRTATPEGQAAPMPAAQAAPMVTEVSRPGIVTFAAIMMFLLGGFQAIFALAEFWNAVWFAGTVYGTFSGRLWLWGIVDAILAVVAFYAGYDILRGGAFGRYVGVAVAGISAVRWFFYIPAEPWAALVMIAVDVLIIYGLVAHAEYFESVRV